MLRAWKFLQLLVCVKHLFKNLQQLPRNSFWYNSCTTTWDGNNDDHDHDDHCCLQRCSVYRQLRVLGKCWLLQTLVRRVHGIELLLHLRQVSFALATATGNNFWGVCAGWQPGKHLHTVPRVQSVCFWWILLSFHEEVCH